MSCAARARALAQAHQWGLVVDSCGGLHGQLHMQSGGLTHLKTMQAFALSGGEFKVMHFAKNGAMLGASANA